MNIYQRNGYSSRRDYLEELAESYGLPLDMVLELAAMLGPNEDFDGLISALQDAEDETWFGDGQEYSVERTD